VPINKSLPGIDWWWPWGGLTGLQTLAALAKDFNSTHTDFQVRPLQYDSSNGAAKLVAAISGGTPPAVETGGTWLDFWLAGGATVLDSYIGKSKIINTQDYIAGILPGGQIKGKTYGFPAVECFLRWEMCYNKDLLDKHNLSSTDLPGDFTTLMQWSKEMTVVSSSGAVQVAGLDPLDAEGGVWGGDPFFWGAAMDYKYYDTGKNAYNVTADQMVEAMTLIQQFEDIVGAEKLTSFEKTTGTWTESPTAMMPTGVEGANINGYWAAGELAKTAATRHFVYGWVPMPASRKGTKLACAGGHYSILPKGSPDPDRGFALIEYLQTNPAMDVIFNTTGWLGGRQSYLNSVDASKYPGLDFYITAAKTATANWGPFFEPLPSYASTQYYNFQQSVNYHKLQPKQALQQLQAALDNEMKSQYPQGIANYTLS
jgi:ABC-type glycerol-3-phosphate transport system substrate-binding protein